MTKEELLKQETITFEDVLKYFDIRSYEALVAYFEMLTQESDLSKINDGDLFFGFKLIYDKVKGDFNPLQEKVMLYSVIMKGIYGLDIDDFSILTSGLGIFRTAIFFDKLLEYNEPSNYYMYLYNEYFNREESIGTIISNGIDSLIRVVLPKLETFSPESLLPYEEKIKSFITEFKNNFKN